MDAIVGVWITSVVGAAAFSAAGYVLGQSQKSVPAPTPAPVVLPPAAPPLPKAASEPKIKVASEAKIKAASEPKIEAAPESKKPDSKKLQVALEVLDAIDPPPPTQRASVPARPPGSNLTMKTPVAFPPPAFSLKPEAEPEDRPTVVPDLATQAAVLQSSVVTIPPPQRAPSLGVPGFADTAATRAMIQDALAQVELAAAETKALEIMKNDLERHLERTRAELKSEIVRRAEAEARAEELSDRLARASEETASLRHRVNTLDRQTKLLRESLRGGRPSGELRIKRDLEEAEDMRAKLRDVVDKLERASLPPAVVGTRVSTPPEGIPRSLPGAPGIPRSLRPASDDSVMLREEVARLTTENGRLRAQTLGSLPPKPMPRESAPEIDLALYEGVIQRLGSVGGLKCAVLADEVGSVVVGQGDLAENLAAFGAYIRDASGRTERLLPLDGVETVDIRDKAGMFLSTRVVVQANALSIVLLASAEGSLAAAKKLIDTSLRLRA